MQRARSFAFAGVYLFFLSWIILFKLQWPHLGAADGRTIKLLPFFADSAHAGSGVKESLVNVLLFSPLGLNLRLLRPQLGWLRAVAAGLGIPFLFELLQYVLAVGSSDTTDLLTNLAGTAAGFAIAGRIPRLRSLCAWLGIVLAVLALGFVASPLRFAAPA